MTKPQDKEAEAQELREREILRRMLNTPPKPHEPSAAMKRATKKPATAPKKG